MDILPMIKADRKRYGGGKLYAFQRYFRMVQGSKNAFFRTFYKILFRLAIRSRHIELSTSTLIGEGLFFGHAYGITINPNSIIGRNVNIHKGVTIGQENRGPRKGTPTIKDHVWIGVNSTIVGKITIGSDVLIAPNCYVNRDVPDHSIVLGNPCTIKHKDNATEGYINHTV